MTGLEAIGPPGINVYSPGSKIFETTSECIQEFPLTKTFISIFLYNLNLLLSFIDESNLIISDLRKTRILIP